MKKATSLLLALIMALSLVACGGTQSSTSGSSASTTPASSGSGSAEPSASAGYDKAVITAAVHTSGTNSLEYMMVDHFKELIEDRSGGAITVEIFGEGQLGDEAAITEQIATNTVQLATTGFSGLDKYIKSINCWSVPYLFTSSEQVQASWDGQIGDVARERFAENGIRYVGNIYRGNRQMTSSKLVNTPEDLKGLNLRLPDTSAWITVWESMGAIISAIPAAEVFQALQTGVVEAQENPISSIYAKGLWEVQDYLVMTNHLVDFLGLIESKDFHEGLNAETQALIDECIQESLDWAKEFGEQQEAELLADMQSKGMTVIEVDSSAFAEAAQGGIQKLMSNWEDWVYDAAMEAASK